MKTNHLRIKVRYFFSVECDHFNPVNAINLFHSYGVLYFSRKVFIRRMSGSDIQLPYVQTMRRRTLIRQGFSSEGCVYPEPCGTAGDGDPAEWISERKTGPSAILDQPPLTSPTRPACLNPCSGFHPACLSF